MLILVTLWRPNAALLDVGFRDRLERNGADAMNTGVAMAIRPARPITAGLSQVARMDRRERTRVLRELRRQHGGLRRAYACVAVSRVLAFGAGLALALAVVVLAQGASVWWVVALIFVGLAGFLSVTVILTDNRFDLVLAVVGAHRTDELLEQLSVESRNSGDMEPERRPESRRGRHAADTRVSGWP